MFESFERELLMHKAPSVGSITKKIMEVNPHLSAKGIMDIVRRSVQAQGGLAGEFSSAEVIDEERALELARESLLSN